MRMDHVVIIEFPSNLGLREPSPGHDPGVRKLPAWLRKHHFHHLIAPEKIYTLSPPAYQMHPDPASGVLNADAIVQYAKEQAKLLGDVLSENKFPLVIGGDCSIAIGNTLALKQKGAYALFYLDGHTDFIDPQLSQTGGAGGMAAAIVAGVGHKKMTDIHGQYPYINAEHVWCVGNREYDDAGLTIIQSRANRYGNHHPGS